MVKTLPEIIAHRGSTYLAPENTLSAFRNAIDLGADGVEMDVQQTRDHGLTIMSFWAILIRFFAPIVIFIIFLRAVGVNVGF